MKDETLAVVLLNLAFFWRREERRRSSLFNALHSHSSSFYPSSLSRWLFFSDFILPRHFYSTQKNLKPTPPLSLPHALCYYSLPPLIRDVLVSFCVLYCCNIPALLPFSFLTSVVVLLSTVVTFNVV